MVFRDLVLYFVGIGSKRVEIFKGQVESKHGEVASSGDDPRLTHVVIDEAIESNPVSCRKLLIRECKVLQREVSYVSAKWLVGCLKEKRLIPIDEFLVGIVEFCGVEEAPGGKRQKISETVDVSVITQSQQPGSSNTQAYFLCSRPSSTSKIHPGNLAIVAELKKLADAYRATKDTWRLYSYEKAISAIEKHDTAISTYQEAVALPGVGEKMALKVMEIKESGCLRKANEICDNAETKVLQLFCQVWGAGPSTAEEWYRCGCRSLADLEGLTTLTNQQRIGLKHYEDLLLRIPRPEVEEFGNVVKEAVRKVSKSLRTELVGSFRRGKETCGDVDVMVVNTSEKSANEILVSTVNILKDKGIVTDDLTSSETGRQKKWFGVAQLNPTSPHRRLDIFVVPESEEAAALIHFTGSALFNRSIRLLASKKGMCLTEHGLYVNTVRRGCEVVHEGTSVPMINEEAIFLHLGLEYREPTQRDH